MPNLWDDIAKTIRESVDTVVEKTEELTKIGRIKVDIINIKRNVEKNFSELGGKVYHLIVEEKQTAIAGNKEVKELIECVKILEKELHEKNEELKRIKERDVERKAAAQKAKEGAKATSKPAASSGDKTEKPAAAAPFSPPEKKKSGSASKGEKGTASKSNRAKKSGSSGTSASKKEKN